MSGLIERTEQINARMAEDGIGHGPREGADRLRELEAVIREMLEVLEYIAELRLDGDPEAEWVIKREAEAAIAKAKEALAR